MRLATVTCIRACVVHAFGIESDRKLYPPGNARRGKEGGEGSDMAHQGKVQLTYVMVAPPEEVAEGDRIFRSHGPWMEATHHRSGEKALLSYKLSKAPELSNPLDSGSEPTGRTCFILSEVYETEAGVSDHFAQAAESWEDFPALGEWLQKCEVAGLPAARIANSLW